MNFRFPAALPRLLVASWLTVLGSSQGASAHAIAVAATLASGLSLADHGVPARTETRIVLHFNATVERHIATAELLGADDAPQPLDAKITARSDAMEITLPPLAPGRYVLRYKILAADGHLTEDLIRFTVAGDGPAAAGERPAPDGTPNSGAAPR